MVIQCVVEDEPEHIGHSHITFAVVEKSTDLGFSLKPLKQKQMIDGLCYLLQEIYGIENKNADRGKVGILKDGIILSRSNLLCGLFIMKISSITRLSCSQDHKLPNKFCYRWYIILLL